MLVHDLLLALGIAAVLTLALEVGNRIRGERSRQRVLLYFAVLFPATWAGGVWLTPREGPFLGLAWIPFLLIGLVTALLLALLRPFRAPDPTTVRLVTQEEHRAERRSAAWTRNVFLGGFVLLMCLLILVRYLRG